MFHVTILDVLVAVSIEWYDRLTVDVRRLKVDGSMA
jgi:hypothetical protein